MRIAAATRAMAASMRKPGPIDASAATPWALASE